MEHTFSCCRFSYERHCDRHAGLHPPLDPIPAWTRSGVGFQPLAAAGNIYLSLTSGAIAALEESTAREVWRLALPRPYSQVAMKDGAFVLHDGHMLVYFDRELMVVDPAKGEVTARHPVPPFPLYGAAAERDALVCQFENGGKLFLGALDLRTGAFLWRQPWPGVNPILTASEGIVCVRPNRGVLSGIDIASGQTRWSFSVEETGRHKDALGDEYEGELIGVPIAAGGQVIAAVLGHYVLALDVATGERRWARTLNTRNPFNLSYYPDGKLYVLGPRYFHVLNVNTGELVEEHDCEDVFKQSGVAGPFTDLGISDDYIYAVDFVGWLIAFHKTRHTIDWTFRCQSKVAALAAPVVLANRMYLLDGRGNFCAFGERA
ncbi:MAG: PQQ-binding-like beta-propeller repeat protein [Bryobacteraceae bacterium]